MNQLERYLLKRGSAPLREAADFFIRIRQPREEVKEAEPVNPIDALYPASTKEAGDVISMDKARRNLGFQAKRILRDKKLLRHAKPGLGTGLVLGATGIKALERLGKGGKSKSKEPEKEASARAVLRKFAETLGDSGAEMSAPAGSRDMQPIHYLQAEMMAQKAQEARESQYYQQMAEAANMDAQAAQEQMGGLQEQLMQLQDTASQAGAQVQQATQDALAAQDEALKQTQVAANMRMGMQKMRAQMMEVASQDPAEVASQELQAGLQGEAAPVPDSGMEGELPPEEPPAPGTPGAEGPAPEPEPPPEGVSMETAEPAGGMKQGSMSETAGAVATQLKNRLPWALAGAGLGLAHHRYLSGAAPRLRRRVQQLEADQEGGFRQALRLVAEKKRLAEAEVAQQRPGPSMAAQSLRGAAAGALMGPSIGENVKGIADSARRL